MHYDHSNVAHARNLRKNMTPQEAKLWYQFLKKYPIRFQRQKPIDQYIVDFYCAKANLIVELDGGGHYEPEQAQKDKIRTQNLEEHGFMILRFCNIDVDKNFYNVCSLINDTVQERIPPLLREKASHLSCGLK